MEVSTAQRGNILTLAFFQLQIQLCPNLTHFLPQLVCRLGQRAHKRIHCLQMQVIRHHILIIHYPAVAKIFIIQVIVILNIILISKALILSIPTAMPALRGPPPWPCGTAASSESGV